MVETVINWVLGASLLAGLAGLTFPVFNPATALGIVALVVAIAFVAGTVPALRAARQDPIEALRYE